MAGFNFYATIEVKIVFIYSSWLVGISKSSNCGVYLHRTLSKTVTNACLARILYIPLKGNELIADSFLCP